MKINISDYIAETEIVKCIKDLIAIPSCDGTLNQETKVAINIGQKGLEWFEVHFIGKSAHGAAYKEGVNAINMAVKFIDMEERFCRLSCAVLLRAANKDNKNLLKPDYRSSQSRTLICLIPLCEVSGV